MNKNEVILLLKQMENNFFTFEVRCKVHAGYKSLLEECQSHVQRKDFTKRYRNEYKEGVKDERPIQGVDRIYWKSVMQSETITRWTPFFTQSETIGVCFSPTASGKSLIIYLLSVWYAMKDREECSYSCSHNIFGRTNAF